jgi:hypothetical protein
MQSVVAGLALQRQQDEGPVLPGSKRNRQEVPAAAVRIRVWRKFGDSMPELQAVPEWLMSAHATSAATELTWSLWGRMYCATRSSLGIQRAKALIAICAAEGNCLHSTPPSPPAPHLKNCLALSYSPLIAWLPMIPCKLDSDWCLSSLKLLCWCDTGPLLGKFSAHQILCADQHISWIHKKHFACECMQNVRYSGTFVVLFQ